MKKSVIIPLSCLIFSIIAVSGCSDFDSINTNPNAPIKVTSGMLATHIILAIIEPSGITKGFMQDKMLAKYIGWNEKEEDTQYNKFGRITFGRLLTLNNIPKMVKYAQSEQIKKSYEALGHFADAFEFFELTMRVGDIPYSEALKGISNGNYKPAYDSQKKVFLGILNELEKADKLFAGGSNFEGDPVYGGNVNKWRKLVNTFELKVLINLYKKTDGSDLNVIQRFKDIVNNKPIFESNADNFQLIFHDEEGQKYPWYKDGNNFLQYSMVSSLLIGSLKNLKDKRLFYYAQPSPVQLKKGKSADDWGAYKGTNVAAEFHEIKSIASSDDYSQENLRYSQIPQGVPYVLLSYGQMNLILAEAAARGWISGTGKAYYNKGIRAAMHFVTAHTPDEPEFTHGVSITDDYINRYIHSSKVKYASSFTKQLQQIILQKYIMMFMQNGYNAYFEYRRTGYPQFPINPNSNLNTDKNKIPVRWKYPQDELDHNSKHVHQAINRQYNGVDNVNAKMWLLKD